MSPERVSVREEGEGHSMLMDQKQKMCRNQQCARGFLMLHELDSLTNRTDANNNTSLSSIKWLRGWYQPSSQKVLKIPAS